MEATPILDYEVLYKQENSEKEELLIAISALRHELAQLKKMIFGSRHERFVPTEGNPAQMALDLAVDAIANVTTENISVNQTKTIVTVTPQPISHPGRTKLPGHLRREKIVIEPGTIPEGSKKVGKEITEELEYEPGELFVTKYVRPKYAAPASEDGSVKIAIAAMPVHPVEKSHCGPRPANTSDH